MAAVRPLYVRLAAAHRRALFERILSRCERRWGGAPPVVVFDLDGTLFDNRPRTRAIFHDLAAAWEEAHPDVAARLRSVRSSELAYHVSESFERLGITRHDLVEEAFGFWRARF